MDFWLVWWFLVILLGCFSFCLFHLLSAMLIMIFYLSQNFWSYWFSLEFIMVVLLGIFLSFLVFFKLSWFSAQYHLLDFLIDKGCFLFMLSHFSYLRLTLPEISKIGHCSRGQPEGSLSIASTPRYRGGHYAFFWITLLYSWYISYNVSRRYQVPFFKSLVWLNLGLNSGLPGHWWTLEPLGFWAGLFTQRIVTYFGEKIPKSDHN